MVRRTKRSKRSNSVRKFLSKRSKRSKSARNLRSKRFRGSMIDFQPIKKIVSGDSFDDKQKITVLTQGWTIVFMHMDNNFEGMVFKSITAIPDGATYNTDVLHSHAKFTVKLKHSVPSPLSKTFRKKLGNLLNEKTGEISLISETNTLNYKLHCYTDGKHIPKNDILTLLKAANGIKLIR